MVCRIVPKPHSCAVYFWRAWAFYFLLICLFSLAIEWWLDGPREDSYAGGAAAFALAAAIIAWIVVRSWARYGWFSGERRECFLTMVEAGLLIEAPAKGMSLYLPWKGLSYRRSGDMLLISTHGALRSIVSVGGIPREKRATLLAGLREHAGQGQARHGLFAPEKAAAPFAAAPAQDKLPALPPAPVPPPTPVTSSSAALFSNTPAQWKEYLRFAHRPDWLACAFCLACIAGLSLTGGVLAWAEDWGSAVFMFLFATYLLCKLGCPGRRQRSAPGPIRVELTRTELIERWDDGSWARFRLPEAEAASLVRLPHVWCLQRRNELGSFLFDAGDEPPPQLAPYRREPAPRNRLRVALGLLVALLSGVSGYCALPILEKPDEFELALRALPTQPDDASLRSFVENHFAMGSLYGTPSLTPITHPEGQGIIGYTLRFTEEEPEGEECLGHFALVCSVKFSTEGEILDYESGPAPWCPCAACAESRWGGRMGGE